MLPLVGHHFLNLYKYILDVFDIIFFGPARNLNPEKLLLSCGVLPILARSLLTLQRT